MSDSQDTNATTTDDKPESKGTPLFNDADFAPDASKPQFVEPGSDAEREELEARKVSVDDKQDSKEKGDDEVESEEEEYTPLEPETPAPQVQDPGDYQAKDYSFEVTTYDEDGKNPKKHKIATPEDWDNLLETDVLFGNTSEMMKADRKVTSMENKLDADKQAWEKDKAAFEEVSQAEVAKRAYVDNIGNELNYLVAKGKLPPVDKKFDNVDWRDPEVAKQPGIKEHTEVINYLLQENILRRKAGLSDIGATEAYNALQLEQRDSKDAEERQKAAEVRKRAGSRVASSTPPPISNVPKGISVGRGGSLRDLDYL